MNLSTRGRLLAAVPLLLTGGLLLTPAPMAAAAPAPVTVARGDGGHTTTPSEPTKDAPTATAEPAPPETEAAKQAPKPTPEDTSKAEHPAGDAKDAKDAKGSTESSRAGGPTTVEAGSSTRVDAPPGSLAESPAQGGADPAPFNAEPVVPATTLATAPLGAMVGISLGPGLVIWPLLLAIDIVAISFLVRHYMRRRVTPPG